MMHKLFCIAAISSIAHGAAAQQGTELSAYGGLALHSLAYSKNITQNAPSAGPAGGIRLLLPAGKNWQVGAGIEAGSAKMNITVYTPAWGYYPDTWRTGDARVMSPYTSLYGIANRNIPLNKKGLYLYAGATLGVTHFGTELAYSNTAFTYLAGLQAGVQLPVAGRWSLGLEEAFRAPATMSIKDGGGRVGRLAVYHFYTNISIRYRLFDKKEDTKEKAQAAES